MKDYQKYLKPKDGVLVRHPGTMTLMPKEGQLVDWCGVAGRYWRRRVKDKDCLITGPPVREASKVETDTTNVSKDQKHKHKKNI